MLRICEVKNPSAKKPPKMAQATILDLHKLYLTRHCITASA